ncbi:hypothetical protein AVEN_50544-1 [Araneus ventricosus]|uniref:Uncharacterized protein n=1 Tax=Araneus ventricosus TaxID=182803 RepID=A0A4Y2ARS3_ARAVE|nr:hypothetical protein AVEN_50544-1 [Araneus ventricosus]
METKSQKLVLVILKKAWTSNLRAIFSPMEIPQQIFHHQYLRRPHPLKHVPVMVKGRGSNRKHYSSFSGYGQGKGCPFQNHKEGSIYVSKDRTSWTVTSASHTRVGKYGAQIVLKEIPGPTSYTKRNAGENVSSAWRLFMDESMLRHIKKCTGAEAVLNNEENWAVSLEELMLL